MNLIQFNSHSFVLFSFHSCPNEAGSSSNKQQSSTIDENCATGSGGSLTGNGDLPQSQTHAPPLQVCELTNIALG